MDFLSYFESRIVSRGRAYYRSGNARITSVVGNVVYGEVEGSDGHVYDVQIDLKKPYNSYCDCPYASGDEDMCKHEVALYYEYLEHKDEYVKSTASSNVKFDSVEEAVESYIKNLNNSQKEEILKTLIIESPEWLREKYLPKYKEDIIDKLK